MFLITFLCIFFFRFPKDPQLRQQWIRAVHRKNFVPSATAVLCTKHFQCEDIDRSSLSTVRIRENAVPAIFSALPSDLHIAKKASKTPCE